MAKKNMKFHKKEEFQTHIVWTLKKELEEHIMRERDCPHLWIYIINMVEIVILLKSIYGNNTYQNPNGLLHKSRK